jgi:hypothetical protein
VDFTCRKCAIGGATCLLRFSKSPKPRYKYERWKTPEGGISDHCVDVMPRPRPIKDPSKETCPEWRDNAGNSRAEVEKAMARGEYQYN